MRWGQRAERGNDEPSKLAVALRSPDIGTARRIAPPSDRPDDRTDKTNQRERQNRFKNHLGLLQWKHSCKSTRWNPVTSEDIGTKNNECAISDAIKSGARRYLAERYSPERSGVKTTTPPSAAASCISLTFRPPGAVAFSCLSRSRYASLAEAIWQRCKSDLGLTKTEMFFSKTEFFHNNRLSKSSSCGRLHLECLVSTPEPSKAQRIQAVFEHDSEQTSACSISFVHPMPALSEHAGGLTAMAPVPRRLSSRGGMKRRSGNRSATSRSSPRGTPCGATT
jgi:hypothetical protein